MYEWWSILILKLVQKLKQNIITKTSFGYLDIICWEDVKRIRELQKFEVNLEDQFCQAEKKVMSDVHVLVCSDFYSKSALGETWCSA